MSVKQIVFKECELLKEGYTKAGKLWQKYQYYGNDGEHYVLFGKLELEKPYQLAQKTREFNGKTFTDWIVVPDGKTEAKSGSGAGVKAIMDKMDGLLAEIQDVKRILVQFETRADKKDEALLPF